MDERPAPQRPLSSTHSNYVFARNVDDRQRLRHQFSLLREDFNLWFDQALQLGGLPTDPDGAHWSVLDMGCGEGHYTREIAQRYPGARVTGMDVDAASIHAAAAASASQANVRFLAHDASQPMAETVSVDAAVMWMVLSYLPDKRTALANLAAALRPGGVLLLGDIPDEPMVLDHPAAARIRPAGRETMRRLGLVGLEDSLEPLLREVGFDDVTSVVLRYPVGGATGCGQRWCLQALMSFSAGKVAVVDICGLMEGEEYDRQLERLASESVLDLSGEARFLVTLARRT
jgi:SAM-dependent methyltransferase